MKIRRIVEITIFVCFLLFPGVAIFLTVYTIQQVHTQSIILEGPTGIWASTQLEREIVRLREVTWRIALQDSVSADAYRQVRDIMLSRIAVSEDYQRNYGTDEAEKAAFDAVMVALREFQELEGDAVPDAQLARRLIPKLDALAKASRGLIVARNESDRRLTLAFRDGVTALQNMLIGSIVGMVLLCGALFYVARRFLHNDLNTAYAQLQQHADELERSKAQLALANEAIQEQNSELAQALAELRQNIQERQELQDTVLTIAFPIIPVADHILVMPLVGDISSDRIALARSRLLQAILDARARHAIIDVTGVTLIDDEGMLALVKLSSAIRLIGCLPMVVGITPPIAKALVHIGVQDDVFVTFSTLQQGIEWAIAAQQ